MDLAVVGLDSIGVGVVAGAFNQIAAIWIGLVTVGGEGRGQWCAGVCGVVEDQQQIAALEAQELDGGIGIPELSFLSLAPGASAVPRLGANDVPIRPAGIVSAAPAVADEVVVRDRSYGRLDVADSRADAVRFGPGVKLGVPAEKERATVGTDHFGVVARLVIRRQQNVAVGQSERTIADHHSFRHGQQHRIGPGRGPIAGDLRLNQRRGPGLAVANDIEQPHHAVGGLPHHRIAFRAKGRVGDGHGCGPPGLPFGQTGAVHSGVGSVFARAGVVRQV